MAVSARARELFLAELAAHDIVPEEDEDGCYKIVLGEMTLTISLENKSREFEETGDESVLKQFVEVILQHQTMVPQDWESARERLYYAAEPADHNFDDTCLQKVKRARYLSWIVRGFRLGQINKAEVASEKTGRVVVR